MSTTSNFELPTELRTEEQIRAWDAVNQCKRRMEQIKDTAAQTIQNAPPPMQQFIFQALLAEMQQLGSVVVKIRSNCNHVARSWREIDDTVIDISQCIVCQLDLS